jgi:pyruvate dehydrogenase E2 component (dihydrolipoamide acetyltransferase)
LATDLRLPQLGDIMTEGRLTAWLQEDGAAVEAGQPLYDLETDKVSFTVEAPAGGVLRHVVPAGETVAVGTVVGQLLAAGEPATPLPPRGRGGPATARREGSEVAATPAARALARELGVDLTTIAVTGRIREADVRAAAGTGDSLPYAGRRRAIGERMLRSRQTTAALTLTSQVGADAALDLIDELNRSWRDEGVVLTLTRLIVRACALALRDHPQLNSRLRDERIELPGTVDVGLAMDQEAGLMVPVLRGADRLSLRELAAALRELTRRAEAGRLTQAEAGGATFTVTSLAGTVVDAFTPILDPPQAAILGVGRVREVPGFDGDRVVRRRVTTLSLTFDHRVADGGPAARFLGRVAELVEHPAALT